MFQAKVWFVCSGLEIPRTKMYMIFTDTVQTITSVKNPSFFLQILFLIKWCVGRKKARTTTTKKLNWREKFMAPCSKKLESER